METCSSCFKEIFKSFNNFSPCCLVLCQNCFQNTFKSAEIFNCPGCKQVLKPSDFSPEVFLEIKEMPECMNIDSDLTFESLSSETKEKLMKTSGFDFDEHRKSCIDELIDGLS